MIREQRMEIATMQGVVDAALDLQEAWRHANGCECIPAERAFDAAIEEYRKVVA